MRLESDEITQPSLANKNAAWAWLIKPSRRVLMDEEQHQARIASWLTLSVCITFLIVLGIASVLSVLTGVEIRSAFLFSGLLLLFGYVISRTQYFYYGGMLTLFVCSFVPFIFASARPPYEGVWIILMWVILPLVFSTVLLNTRDQIFLTIFDLLGLILLVIIRPEFQNSHIIYFIMWVICAAGILIYLDSYRTLTARKQFAAIQIRKHELENENMLLETKIAESQQLLETSKTESENASHALEQIKWQALGLAELENEIKEVKTLPALANKLVRYICRYTAIPVGALFLANGEELILKGSYAYPFPMKPTPRFKIGSGLVGEAARSQKAVTLRDIPDNYLSITSGLGESKADQIIAIPCFYQNQVIGVLELAALEPFTGDQLQFLTSASKTLASGIYTAQILEENKTLLEEIQKAQIDASQRAKITARPAYEGNMETQATDTNQKEKSHRG